MTAKKHTKTPVIRLLMSLMLAAAMLLTACGQTPANTTAPNAESTKSTTVSTTAAETTTPPATEATTEAPAPTTEEPTTETEDRNSFEGRDDIAYVMIYNPGIYDEDKTLMGFDLNERLNTGKIADQIDVSMSRAEELDTTPKEFSMVSQFDFKAELEALNPDFDDIRAGELVPVHEAGENKLFNVEVREGVKFQPVQFNCVYVGKYCYLWSYETVLDAETAKTIADEFDSRIYPEDVAMFGLPRYAEDGGKVNLLYYPFGYSTLGFFRGADIFSEGQLSADDEEYCRPNYNEALLHLNSNFLDYLEDEELADVIYGTLAHELQHLIVGSAYIETRKMMDTWLNEAMSGFAEETLYPGVKENVGHYEAFLASDTVRHGQSLYNFTCPVIDGNRQDIGVYGSVFLFTQYLAYNNDNEIFSRVHKYWRNSHSKTLNEAEALYNSVSKEYVEKIEKEYTYPSELTFDRADHEWLSKLTLDFHLSLLDQAKDSPEAYKHLENACLLYNEINPADIEGGGRVLFATADGTFTIPEDADYGLIYIGLDKDFQPVTDLEYR